MKKIRKKSRSNENFLKKNYKESFGYIKESKKFIYFAILIFCIFLIAGFFLPTPKIIEEKIFEFIRELLKTTEGMSWLELTRFIFLNNLQSSFFSLIFGIFLGIYSVITIVVNGYVLGFVVLKTTQAEGLFVLWKLFPHGIFELPALFISTGLGVRLGAVIFQNIFKKKKLKFKDFLINSIKTFIFVIIPLLIVAALIEGSLILLMG